MKALHILDERIGKSTTKKRSKKKLINLEDCGVCGVCGGIGLLGNFCVRCEDTGMIYDRSELLEIQESIKTTEERDKYGFVVFYVGDKVRIERDPLFIHGNSNSKVLHEGKIGYVISTTLKQVEIQLENAKTERRKTVRKGKQFVVKLTK